MPACERAVWGGPPRRGTALSVHLRRQSPAAPPKRKGFQYKRQVTSFYFRVVSKPLYKMFLSTLLLYLFGNLQMVVPLHLVQESTFAARIEHALLNVAAVPRHGVNEH